MDEIVLVLVVIERMKQNPSVPRCVAGIGEALEVDGKANEEGQMPRFSGDEARQAAEKHGKDRLIGGA